MFVKNVDWADNPDFDGAIMQHPSTLDEYLVPTHDINEYTSHGFTVLSFSNHASELAFNGKNPIYTGKDRKDRSGRERAAQDRKKQDRTGDERTRRDKIG